MKTEDKNQTLDLDEIPPGYKQSPWPQHGRLVFGPWCLLGAWPAVFSVIEKLEEPEQEKE